MLRVASIGPHFGEEPPLSGIHGSGTVFFAGCSSGCMFCQNWQISIDHRGTELAPDELLSRVATLIRRHVHNINFVTPDHFWPHVADLCRRLREMGVLLPFLFNGSGYHRASQVPRWTEWIDVFLPDFKFADAALAQRCMGDARYTDAALGALQAMVSARGFLEPWDPTGRQTAERGVLVRHLVLPGEIENSLGVLRLLRREFGRHLPLSLMSQFRPTPACLERRQFDRPLRPDEYQTVLDAAEELGFDQVLGQDLHGDDRFRPDFDQKRPFQGNPDPV